VSREPVVDCIDVTSETSLPRDTKLLSVVVLVALLLLFVVVAEPSSPKKGMAGTFEPSMSMTPKDVCLSGRRVMEIERYLRRSNSIMAGMRLYMGYARSEGDLTERMMVYILNRIREQRGLSMAIVTRDMASQAS
jgi:hypothetical protein